MTPFTAVIYALLTVTFVILCCCAIWALEDDGRR